MTDEDRTKINSSDTTNGDGQRDSLTASSMVYRRYRQDILDGTASRPPDPSWIEGCRQLFQARQARRSSSAPGQNAIRADPNVSLGTTPLHGPNG